MAKKFMLAATLLLVATTQVLMAQVISSAVPFLLVAPNSRASGMGEAGVALADDASALHWNPAGLAFQDGQEISISHANWLPMFNLSDLFIDYLVYRRQMPELDGTVGASTLLTAFLILVQVAKKIAWIVVIVAWVLILVRILLGLFT